MTPSHRWPLHPRPQPHESLSSWLFRLAHAYEMPWEEFFRDALGTEPLADHVLDREPPGDLVQTLAVRTGVRPQHLWAMTLVGYVPWIIDTLDPRDATCLSIYATQYRTLLWPETQWMSQGLYDRKTGRYCLPWLVEPYGGEHWLCPHCLRTDRVPYIRLYWRLGLMGSCPIHGCLFVDVPWPACTTILHNTDIPTEPAHRDLLVVDGFSLHAVTRGRVRFNNEEYLLAAVYVRFLRSLIEELFCRRSVAGTCADTIAAIWEEAGCCPYAGLKVSKPFERLSMQQRRDTLRAIGSLLRKLPVSLRRRLSPPVQTQRLPYTLHRLFAFSRPARRYDPRTRRNLLRSKPAWQRGMSAEPPPLQRALTALERLVQSDEGAERLIDFITAYSQQTREQQWQLIREMRATTPPLSQRA